MRHGVPTQTEQSNDGTASERADEGLTDGEREAPAAQSGVTCMHYGRP